VAVALDGIGGLLGVEEFATTPAGYEELLGGCAGSGRWNWSGSRGPAAMAPGWPATSRTKVCGWSSSIALTAKTVAARASPICSTRLARPAPPSRAGPGALPGDRDGAVEAIRVVIVAKRSARSERTQTIHQARSLVVPGPDDVRVRFAKHTTAALVTETAALRPRPRDTVGHATRIALRELGLRVEFLDDQIVRLDELLVPLVTDRSHGLLSLDGVGPETAAMLLVAAGDHPDRVRIETA